MVRRTSSAFTLIELLAVIAIIAVLAALVLAAANGVEVKVMRSRASSEVQAMSTALEGYKTDNGIYPIGNTTAGSGSILLGPPTAPPYPYDPVSANAANYQIASEALYQALSGQTYYANPPAAGTKTYMNFTASQIANPAGPLSYIKDPWNNSYGYSTGDKNSPQTQYPYNGTGFFDLWSTAGRKTSSTTDLAAWVTNWQ